MIDLAGRTFGKWTVQRFSGEYENRAPKWICRCECGIERKVRSTRLLAGKSNGCGHDRYERVRTHGQTGSPTYRVWRSMILRCEVKGNDAYKHYGAKGIKVCERWRHDFSAFLSDVGERPDGMSIDRLDNDRDYEPGNCRWATPAQQSRRRGSVKLSEVSVAEIRRLHAAGAKQADLAKQYNVNQSLISMVVNGRIWK